MEGFDDFASDWKKENSPVATGKTSGNVFGAWLKTSRQQSSLHSIEKGSCTHIDLLKQISKVVNLKYTNTKNY